MQFCRNYEYLCTEVFKLFDIKPKSVAGKAKQFCCDTEQKTMESLIKAQQVAKDKRDSISNTLPNWRKIKLLLNKNLKDYCDNTSIHGLKYIANSNIFPLERIFFTLSFVSVVLGSAFFVDKIYEKWNYTPMIISINSNPTSITQDPFPAVTICNLNQAYKQKALKFSIYSPEYAIIQMLCKRQTNATIARTITDWSNLRSLITEISQPCSKMLLTCRFGGVNYNCTEMFHPIVTDSGLCCVFNMVSPKFILKNVSVCKDCLLQNGTVDVDWSPERGYPSELPKSYSPRPAVGTGQSLGLTVTLDVERDYYYCSSANSVGFKILLHNPLEAPKIREIGLLLSPGYETKVRIQTTKTESEPYLRSINKESRACLFQDEYTLMNYNSYTYRNCLEECLTNMFLKYCGCVTHFMPMPFKNATICSIYEATCVERVHLQSMVSKNSNGCPNICLAGCSDLTYTPNLFNAPLSHSGFQIMNQAIKKLSSSYVDKNIAVVNFYFKENWYRSNKQSEYVGITDFLSSVGGIIGLFFGFSFISVAEFIFYLLLNPIRMLVVALWSKRTKSAKLQKLHNLKSTPRKI